MNEPFVQSLAKFIAENTSFEMRKDMFVGEIPRDTDGVYVLASPSPEPDAETDIEYHDIDIWSRYASDAAGWPKLKEIYRLIHKRHHYQVGNYYVQFSHALGNIDDMDRDATKAKLLKLSLAFIIQDDNNIS